MLAPTAPIFESLAGPTVKATAYETASQSGIRAFFAPLPTRGAARWYPVLARLYVALIFWQHGWMKITDPLGWAGRLLHGGVPPWFAWPSAFVETVGSVLLVLGLGTRLWAFLLTCQMIGAIWIVHWPHGIFGRGGFEFNLALIVILIGLGIFGAGPLSFDALLGRRAASETA